MNSDLPSPAGQRLFITGGASGLGRALAERAARDGWRVCIGDINEARLAETLAALDAIAGGAARGHRALRCDVRHIEDLQRAAELLLAEWGGVDIVVNNAGVALGGAIDEVPGAEFARVVDINLMGVVRGCQVFVPLLKRQGAGHIVNVASLAGLVHLPNMSAYNTSKAGVVALSETLRIELSPHDIAVSVVCPSFFRTNLAESLPEQDSESTRRNSKVINGARHSAEEIAAIVWRGVLRRQQHILPHPEGRLVWIGKRLAPSLFSWLVGHAARWADARPGA